MKKYIISLILVALVAVPVFSQGLTRSELLAQLRQQLAALQAQLAASQLDNSPCSISLVQSNLRLGSRGLAVNQLQRYLIANGYLRMAKPNGDGYFGLTTKTALIKWQRTNGLSSSGIFAKTSKLRLARLCRSLGSTSSIPRVIYSGGSSGGGGGGGYTPPACATDTYTCSDGTVVSRSGANCLFACPTPATLSCTDSDNGKDYFTNGHLVGEMEQTGGVTYHLDSDDACTDATRLSEFYCYEKNGNQYGAWETYNCPNGCSNGACAASPISSPIDLFIRYVSSVEPSPQQNQIKYSVCNSGSASLNDLGYNNTDNQFWVTAYNYVSGSPSEIGRTGAFGLGSLKNGQCAAQATHFAISESALAASRSIILKLDPGNTITQETNKANNTFNFSVPLPCSVTCPNGCLNGACLTSTSVDFAIRYVSSVVSSPQQNQLRFSVCNSGPVSLADLGYSNTDIRVKAYSYVAGAPEERGSMAAFDLANLKNGQCAGQATSFSISEAALAVSRFITLKFDPDNTITQEVNKTNNIFNFKVPSPV